MNDVGGRRGASGAFEREKSEPHEMPRGMPALMAVLLGAVGAWGATYMWYEAGDLDDLMLGDGRTVFRTQPGSSDGDGDGADTVAAVDGAQVYVSICQACHQANGKGVTGAFPPLAASAWVLGDGRGPAGIVLQGLQGEIEVLGSTYNGVMPPFGEQLSDAEIAAVVTYIRSSWGNQAEPIDETTVRDLRERLSDGGMINGGDGVRALADGP